MISLEGVSKFYGPDRWALREVDLVVQRGEFVLLSGPSGAGKSTLLSLLNRQASPSQGRVCLDGVDLAGLSAGEVPALRRRQGMVFQDFRLLYDRSVFENVAFALRVIGLTEEEVGSRTWEALHRCGLAEQAKLNPRRLSGGEQQRACLARAIVHDPELILADEPTGNLDPESGQEIFRLLQEANSRGATVLVATHNQAALGGLSRRVVRMRQGRVESDIPAAFGGQS